MHVRPSDVTIRCYFAEVLLLRGSFIPDTIPRSCKIISKARVTKIELDYTWLVWMRADCEKKIRISYREPHKIRNVLTTSFLEEES